MKFELDKTYVKVLTDLKSKILEAKQKTALSVNKELLLIYWEVGKTITDMQTEEGWGAKTIDRLARDLQCHGLTIRSYWIDLKLRQNVIFT